MELTELERAVLEKLFAGDTTRLRVLRDQLNASTVRERERTGTGFLTRFDVDRGAVPPVDRSGHFGDVDADIDGLAHGAGFLVWIGDGYLEELEGYSYDEPWPEVVRSFMLRYRDARRDLGAFSGG